MGLFHVALWPQNMWITSVQEFNLLINYNKAPYTLANHLYLNG
jgi:hypothetical protein